MQPRPPVAGVQRGALQALGLAALLLLPACDQQAASGSVILVCLDTLRADHLGAYGSAAGLTPNLDRFSSQAVVFEQVWAQANETLYSHASLFTSRYPSELDVLDLSFRLPATTPTLASVFRDAGWSTAAFVAGGHLSAGFGLSSGFEVYDDSESWGSLRDTGARALRWLDAGDEAPFFLFVHGYDTHDRYLKPPPFGYLHADPAHPGLATALLREPGATSGVVEQHAASSQDALSFYADVLPRVGALPITALDPTARPLSDADVAQVRGAYAGSVAWADASFGLLLAGLEARGLLDTTTLVVLSDHGEDLGEHGTFNHRFGLSDETLQVPLMVRLPGGIGGGQRVPGPRELIDVAPTAWALAGLHGPAGVRGRDLLGEAGPEADPGADPARDVAFSQGALRLLSVRSADARLVASGLAADNPWTGSLLAAAPVDGVSLALTGPADQAATLQAALVARLAALDTPARAQR